jgi:hypothetical protein
MEWAEPSLFSMKEENDETLNLRVVDIEVW